MSHTRFEDEGRRLHFEEWDRVLDDHLDTLHALGAVVDPMLDWVWDDREYMTPTQRLGVLVFESAREFLNQLFQDVWSGIEETVPLVKELWDNLRATIGSAMEWMSDLTDRLAELETSGPPPKPVWVDRSRVSHTRTSPARPVRVFRRVVP